MKIPKIKLPNISTVHLAILMGSIILLSFAFVQYQANNRKLDIQQEQSRKEELARQNEESAERTRKLLLGICLDDATDVYWSYIKLNGTKISEDKDGATYNASQSDWNEAQKRKDAAIKVCEIKYGN